MKGLIKLTLLLAVVIICIFGYVLNSQSSIFREFEAALLSVQWMLVVCLTVWCGTFLFLKFSRRDLPLIGLLLIAIAALFVAVSPAPDALTLLFVVTLGRGTQFLLKSGMVNAERDNQKSEASGQWSAVKIFLFGVAMLLAFSSWWHLDVAHIFYPGTRWTGLWNNPNIYGMLMGAGAVLAIGMLGERSRLGCRSTRPASNTGDANHEALLAARGARAVPIFLLIAAGMMGVGLVFSYSRGAWLGTAIGLLYLARAHGKFKWSLKLFLFSIFCFLFLVCVVWFFWNNTPDSAPWYLKRMDFGRASAQHRVAAWKAGFEIMRDHPFGVGWNKTVETYDKYYSPPEGSAAAITTNDYLMLGTQLGIPGLACFLAYVGLCFRRRKQKAESRNLKWKRKGKWRMQKEEGRRKKSTSPRPSPHLTRSPPVKRGEGEAGESVLGVEAVSPVTCPLSLVTTPVTRHSSLQTACLAGALSMLVAFWFDGGLFHLPTAAVFWILLELGSERQKLKTEMLKPRMDTDLEQGKRFSARRQK